MLNDDSSRITLLVQNSHTVFCYFSVSPLLIKEFEDKNGEGSWKNSKPVLKVFEVDNGIASEIKTLYIDVFANNWFIKLDKSGVDVFVKLGRMLVNDSFIPFAVSNTVTTPRSNQSNDFGVYYIDTAEKLHKNADKLAAIENTDEAKNLHREPKPYPFMDQKKN